MVKSVRASFFVLRADSEERISKRSFGEREARFIFAIVDPGLMAEFNKAICLVSMASYSILNSSNFPFISFKAFVSIIFAVTFFFPPSSSTTSCSPSGSIPLIRLQTAVPNNFTAARSCNAPSQSILPSSRTYSRGSPVSYTPVPDVPPPVAVALVALLVLLLLPLTVFGATAVTFPSDAISASIIILSCNFILTKSKSFVSKLSLRPSIASTNRFLVSTIRPSNASLCSSVYTTLPIPTPSRKQYIFVPSPSSSSSSSAGDDSPYL
mmetsp:Transcript_10198/g.12610  ORF Transcript_10198/g.12610 Transcript_10198/m.12610 type:complete len:267 (-) Transcript_10198:808-1608(-)